MVSLERQLFAGEVQEVVALAAVIARVADQCALLDVISNFAHISGTYNYVRPEMTEAIGISIVGGRHPVIEQLSRDPFVTNDTTLTPQKSLQLITGPNMAGKSTYIRQVALIVLIAHTGCFVPATSARIGLTDRVFTRIGAHDNLRAGQSTFMVEMLETAHILHNATKRSLVILDEVGRGTSPEDGFALAWAIAEGLAHDEKGLVLFATHFHALKDIAHTQEHVFNSHLAVAVDNEDLIFLRKVTSGPTDQSYGIVVAEKAGVPKPIIKRAKQIAAMTTQLGGSVNPNQLSLLSSVSPVEADSLLESRLKSIDANSLTPLEALQLVHELKQEL